MSDDYRPREHDHLVEPVLGGLGVGERRPVRRGGLLGALARWWHALLTLLRPR